MTDLDKLYEWFDKNRTKLIKGHEKEFALLHENAVIGYYDSLKSAVEEVSRKNLVEGSFLIQECLSIEDETVSFYSNRVAFA